MRTPASVLEHRSGERGQKSWRTLCPPLIPNWEEKSSETRKWTNGTGSVVKLSGNRRPWTVKVSGRNEYGHVIQKIVSYYEKASEAQLAPEEYNRARASGMAPSVDRLSLTVADVFEAWKAREYLKLKPASISSHNAAWNKRVSRFARRKMRDLTLDELQALLDEDEDAGLSQSLINNDALLRQSRTKIKRAKRAGM